MGLNNVGAILHFCIWGLESLGETRGLPFSSLTVWSDIDDHKLVCRFSCIPNFERARFALLEINE